MHREQLEVIQRVGTATLRAYAVLLDMDASPEVHQAIYGHIQSLDESARSLAGTSDYRDVFQGATSRGTRIEALLNELEVMHGR